MIYKIEVIALTINTNGNMTDYKVHESYLHMKNDA